MLNNEELRKLICWKFKKQIIINDYYYPLKKPMFYLFIIKKFIIKKTLLQKKLCYKKLCCKKTLL